MLELGQRLVIEGHLIAAHRAPVGRIEHKDNGVAQEIAERHGLVRRRLEGEIRRAGAGLENGPALGFLALENSLFLSDGGGHGTSILELTGLLLGREGLYRG